MFLVGLEKKMSVSSNGHIRLELCIGIDQKRVQLLSLEDRGIFNDSFCGIYVASGSCRLG